MCDFVLWAHMISSVTKFIYLSWDYYIHGLVQDSSNSIANALELMQSCTKPSIIIVVSAMSDLQNIFLKF